MPVGVDMAGGSAMRIVKRRSPVQQDSIAVTVRVTSDRCALLGKSQVRFSHTWSPSSLPRCQR